jgi:hypothetical protein
VPDANLLYARDVVLGELGQGKAPDEAWSLARRAMNARLKINTSSSLLKDVDPARLTQLDQNFAKASPTSWRLGGGQIQEDGSVSFLFRFLGSSLGVSGELYLLQKDKKWVVEDLASEEPRDVRGREEAYPYDFSPYERF